MYRIIKNPSGNLTLASDCGNLARTTEGGVFITQDHALAAEALAYLNQPAQGPAKRKGSHRMKSLFGVFG